MTCLVGRARLLTAWSVLACGSWVVDAAGPGEKLVSTPSRIEWNVTAAKVPFDITTDRPVVLGRVNGALYSLAIDTGKTGVTIDDDLVLALRLPAAGKKQPGSSGKPARRIPSAVRVESVELGGVVFQDLEVAVENMDTAAHGERRFDGVLGLSFFANCLVIVDYPRQSLHLKQNPLGEPDGRNVFEFKEKDGRAALPVSFGDVSVDLVVNTAALRGFILPESLRGKIQLVAEPEAESDEGNFDGTVELGQHALVEPPIRFYKDRAAIGQGVLHHFAVAIDQRNRRIRFARPETAPLAFEEASKFGMVIEHAGGVFKVTRIAPGSPAARAGVQTGDRITSIQGRGSYEYNTLAVRTLMRESSVVHFTLERDGAPLLVRLAAEP